MTIRQHIKRRASYAFGLALVTWLGLVALIFTGPPSGLDVPHVLLGMALFMGAVLYLTFFIRCPKCRGNLGVTVLPAMYTRLSRRPVSYCPFCGVSLDHHLEAT